MTAARVPAATPHDARSPARGIDVLHARVVFRERSILDVMDLAVRFIATNARPFGLLALVVVAPAFALASLAATTSWTLAWFVAVALGFAVEVPFTLLASRLVFEPDVDLRGVLRSAGKALPAVLVMRIGWIVVFTFGLVMFLVPVLWTTAATLFTLEVMLLERAGIVHSFGRSQSVGGAASGEAIVAVLAFAAASIAVLVVSELAGRELVGSILQFRMPRPAWVAGGSVFLLLGWFLLVPYLATTRFLVYLNLRARADGWDIQTRFAGIVARAEDQHS